MRFSRLKLENWRNFLAVDVPLRRRMFVIGPNASGKSNLLDAFRFLRDIANPRGGLQQAVELRQGVSQIRSLHARAQPNVAIHVEVDLADGEPWTYRLEFAQDKRHRAIVRREEVGHGGTSILRRPDPLDKSDPSRLTQTHLEQVNANREFRPLQEFLARVQYLHIVPQLIRQPQRWESLPDDPSRTGRSGCSDSSGSSWTASRRSCWRNPNSPSIGRSSGTCPPCLRESPGAWIGRCS